MMMALLQLPLLKRFLTTDNTQISIGLLTISQINVKPDDFHNEVAARVAASARAEVLAETLASKDRVIAQASAPLAHVCNIVHVCIFASKDRFIA